MKIKTIPQKKELLPNLDLPREVFVARVRKAEMQACKVQKFNPVIESGELTIEELKAMIKKAEEGPFYTLEEGQEMIRQWREQRRNM